MPKATPLLALTLCLAGLLPGRVASGFDEPEVIARSTRVIEQMAANPDTGIPLDLLKHSEGIIVVPDMISGGFVFGAKYGRGVFIVRDGKGTWGNPVLITIAGGSFGLQAGGQATEVLMVVRKKDTVTRLLAGKGKVTLGVDAGVAAGPAGTKVGADTDLEMRAEILTYAKSRGLFAGAALGGAGIRVDRTANGIYYDNFAATTFQIIEGESTVVVPLEASKLRAVLGAITDPPPAEGDPDAPLDARVSRSTKTRRSDDPDAMPAGRTSTRRRRPIEDQDDAPPPRQARASTRRRPSADPDQPQDDRPRTRNRPTNPEDAPTDDPPPPVRKKKPAPKTDPPAPQSAPADPSSE